MPRAKRTRASSVHEDAQTYQHPTADLPARPEIGTQAHFQSKRGQIAVNVIDPRGNELLVVKKLEAVE